jgi:hypothetical protein
MKNCYLCHHPVEDDEGREMSISYSERDPTRDTVPWIKLTEWVHRSCMEAAERLLSSCSRYDLDFVAQAIDAMRVCTWSPAVAEKCRRLLKDLKALKAPQEVA